VLTRAVIKGNRELTSVEKELAKGMEYNLDLTRMTHDMARAFYGEPTDEQKHGCRKSLTRVWMQFFVKNEPRHRE